MKNADEMFHRVAFRSMFRLLVIAIASSPIGVTSMMRRYVPPKCRFLQEPHDLTPQKTGSCIVTAAKTSNLT
jgi:hypothetical protein